MSATTMYAPPLRLAPAVHENQARMGWLLRARHAARKALDAALAAPRKAAAYVGRAAHRVHQEAATAWLRRAAARLWRPLAGVLRSMGASGTLAAVTGLVTSPMGRSLLTKTAGTIGKALGWVARKAYSGVDRALRLFGRPGHQAADALFAGVVSLGGKLAAVAAPVVHRVARLSERAR